jgi:hypothetical protein
VDGLKLPDAPPARRQLHGRPAADLLGMAARRLRKLEG